MNAMAALRQYQTVNVHAQVGEASPHRLIQMLMDGGLSRMAQARGAMMRGDIPQKCELIGKSISIIGGLRDGLDLDKGGELALNLDRLYAYMTTRLCEINVSNDVTALEEVMGLLRDVKSGWDAVAH